MDRALAIWIILDTITVHTYVNLHQNLMLNLWTVDTNGYEMIILQIWILDNDADTYEISRLR